MQRSGIRSTKELEEVINGTSFVEEEFLAELGYSVLRFIGFTSNARALKVACRLGETGKLVTLDARIPTVEEIINDFCREC
ncbi:MAG: hypothetical protein ACLFUB_21815 [Cyclobacteriaceae bacterium]